MSSEHPVARVAATLRKRLAQTEFTDDLGFSLEALRNVAHELRETDLPRRHGQFQWLASAADTCGRTDNEIHDFLYQIDQRFNVDEQFIFDLSFGTDRTALFFAGLIAGSCRFLSASLDPDHRREATERALRGKLEMAIQMAEASATGSPPPKFGAEGPGGGEG